MFAIIANDDEINYVIHNLERYVFINIFTSRWRWRFHDLLTCRSGVNLWELKVLIRPCVAGGVNKIDIKGNSLKSDSQFCR